MTDKNPFSKIRAFYRRHRRMPSYSEMMRLFGYKSKNGVTKLVQKFSNLELIERDSTGRLIPGRKFFVLPLLGYVGASFPSPAEEELVDTITLDEFLIQNRDATYMVKVQGDSMQDAGIIEGDIVLVERGKQPKDGDIVIANVDSDYTMKYFRKRGRKVWLEAANKNYKPILPSESLDVVAIVKAVIRKY